MKRILLILIAAFFTFTVNAQVTIAEIHGTGDVSPLDGQTITTTGVIVGMRVGSTSGEIYGYFIQDAAGARNGIYVYDDTNQSIVQGDEITFSAEVAEHYEMTELKNVTGLTINSNSNTITSTTLIATDAITEDYEGVLITVNNAECTAEIVEHGIWTTNDGTDDLKVDDWMYHHEPSLGDVYKLTGCMIYDFDERKICPRNAEDIDESVSIDILSGKYGIYPNPTSSILNINSNSNINKIVVSNVIGQRILNINNIDSKNYTLDVENLKNGVYLINIVNIDGTSSITKFIKE